MAQTNRKYAATRMRKKNPMHNPETVAKMVKARHRNHTFLSRGGNGKLTRQQVALAALIEQSEMEHAIPTAPATGKFISLPSHYKVDIAIPDVKLAVEVDGKTHKTKKWKFLDQRKTEVLTSLGWTVLRFWNEEVDQDAKRAANIVMSTISKLKETTTISQTVS